MNPQRCYRYSPEAAITHKQPEARPLALTNAALGVGNTPDPTLHLILTAQRITRTGGLSADGSRQRLGSRRPARLTAAGR